MSEEAPFLSGWKLTLARILAIVFVILTTILAFQLRDRADELRGYGYAGIFLISILANATIILPVPGVALTFTLGAVFHPIGVALAAGAGATLGELTGYLAGFSGQALIGQVDYYRRVERWMERYGGWVVLGLALIPNPLFDVGGAAAGALRMPVAKFLGWAFIGKTLKMLIFAFAGAASLDALLL